MGYLMARAVDGCEGLRGNGTLRGFGMMRGQYVAGHLHRHSGDALWDVLVVTGTGMSMQRCHMCLVLWYCFPHTSMR